MMRKFGTPLLVGLLCALAGLGVAQAATHHRRHARHKRVHGLTAPALLSPANNSRSEQVPTLTWGAVSGAVEYEYQISADSHFNSIVLGSGPGRGTNQTHNRAASLFAPVTDGTYYWRVRGLTSKKEPGPWSGTRRLVKSWSTTPQLIGPGPGAAIAWPSTPLVMSWTTVPYAKEYVVTIATDPALSNIVLGSASSPQKTTGTVFALPKTLPVGQYYWAIAPVDAEGHRGARSEVRSFSWSWPTSTTTQVNDLNADPRVFDPQFSWAPIPGASKYEVEVNSAEGFPVGSKWCCTNTTTGTTLSPTQALANNEYYWRVRALDANGNAGEWNVGPKFTKAFDGVTPTIPNLTMSDANGNALPPGVETDSPIITWSPVPGAASYQVQVTRYVPKAGCNWGAVGSTEKQTVNTAGMAWTPLGELNTRIGPVPEWPAPDSLRNLAEGFSYCARVLARSDDDGKGTQVVSNWTQVGGLNQPAFFFKPQPPAGSPVGEVLETESGAYLPVRTGATPSLEGSCPATPTCRSTPLFTWNRVPGATSYYVVIARDALFTHVIDVASTVIPAYAPQLNGEMPLDDETTTYYWAVVPAKEGAVFALPPEQDAPQQFNKSSVPPTPFGPLNGTEVSTQPTFSWGPAEGALNYTLQVSQDPTFGNPLDNVKTDSTAYTSSTTYPANVTLYWRVRANTPNTKTEGLHWSEVQTFRRTLPVPVPSAANPGGGQAIPSLSWAPVVGATGYELHVEQSNGSTKDFALNSTAYTPTELFATGIWRWSVRAAFPTSGFGTVPGGYSAPANPFVHTLAPPSGVKGTKSGSQVVISWNPDPYAKEYEVDVASSDSFSFSSSIDSRHVEGTSWAPDIDFSRASNRGTLYWRVAAIDERGDAGPFAEGRFVKPRSKPRCKIKRSKHGAKKCVVSKKHKRKHH